MKHSSTSQTWPIYQPQSPDSQRHGPPADYVQKAQTCYGCPPSLDLGSAFPPPAKSEITEEILHILPQRRISTSSGHTSFHRPSSHFSLGYPIFRLNNSNPKKTFPARKPLLIFENPFCSSLSLFSLQHPFGDGGIITLHKMQAHNRFRGHYDILSSSSNNSTLYCLSLIFSQTCLL